ncbi:Alpha/Beta hydrolase protein [Stachybotrys elegans]|uniref:Alpha/Beta hydrolase protein n=1 Tax=Stachybotrys elegans TaxID=80388 RepID=A0A8K0SLE0_9HYPO|nr:Alpha/Beta hydrolase protein [Stachybotrys elegans]
MFHYGVRVVALSLALLPVAAFTNGCTGDNAINPLCQTNETPYIRSFFYVGGRYVETATGNVTVDQIYVEKLLPVHGVSQPNPLVFFHGGGTSAVTWLNTPDNRMGWASYFISQGYAVYLVDAYSGARSAANDFASLTFAPGVSREIAQARWTAPSENHTQWPGSGVDNDPAFQAFVKTLIPWTLNFERQELAMRASGCKLLSLITKSNTRHGSRLGKAFLIAHSLGAFYPILLSNDCPEFIKGSINLEPATTPFWRYNSGELGGVPQSPWGLTFSRLSYDPPINNASELHVETVGEDTLEQRQCYQQSEPARKLPNVSRVPYLGLSGEAGFITASGRCIADYLRQVGVTLQWIQLEDVGIRGNGHFMHVELNNLEIAKLVENWMSNI